MLKNDRVRVQLIGSDDPPKKVHLNRVKVVHQQMARRDEIPQCLDPFPTRTQDCPNLKRIMEEEDEVWVVPTATPPQPVEEEGNVTSPRHLRSGGPAVERSIPENSRI